MVGPTDASFSAFPLTSVSQGAAGNGAPVGLVVLANATLLTLPGRLNDVSRVLMLGGSLISQGADGVAQVKTQAGLVALKVPVTLPTGHPLTLQILPGQPPTQAVVLGPPPLQPLKTIAGDGGASVVLPSTLPLAGDAATLSSVFRPGQAMTAAFYATADNQAAPLTPALTASASPPAITSAALAAPFVVLPAATPLLSKAAPVPREGKTGGAGMVQMLMTLQEDGADDAAPLTSTALPPSFSASSIPMMARILASALPTENGQAALMEAMANPTANPAAKQVMGTMTGATLAGQPILTGAGALIVLETNALPPLGAQFALEMTPLLPTAPLATGGWSSLGEAMKALMREDLPAERLVARGLLPQAGPTLAAAIGAFFGAARAGDGRAWLGARGVQALSALGKDDLLADIDDAFSSEAKELANTPAGAWRVYHLPFWAQGEMQRVTINTQQRDDTTTESGDNDRMTRFVVDVGTSPLGALQLDGLVKARQFDLILRTKEPLTDDDKTAITILFHESLGAIGFAGTLSYQTGAFFTAPVVAAPVGVSA